MQRKIGTAYDGAASSDLQFARVEPLRRVVARLEACQRTLRDHLLAADNKTPPMLQVSELLESAGLAIERSEVVSDVEQQEQARAKLHIVVAGAFPDLFRAIETLENAHPPIRVVSLGVQPVAPDRVQGDLVIVRTWRVEP